MKVAFITTWFPTIEKPNKGVFVLEHAKTIKETGVDLEIFHIDIANSTSLYKKNTNNEVVDGVNVHRIEIRSFLWKFIYTFPQLLWLLIKKELIGHFDIVHSNVIHPAGVVGSKLSKQLNVPHVLSEHWSNAGYHLSRSLLGRSARKAIEQVAVVMPVSKFLANSIEKWCAKIEVVPNVVDSKVFYPGDDKSKNNELQFIMIGSWNKGKTIFKRPEIPFEALEKIAKEYSYSFNLKVIGEGKIMDELKAKNWSFPVEYLGFLSKEKIGQELRGSDVLLQASESETFSLVVAEALSCNTYVIASKVGAIPELVDHNNGKLVNNTIEEWISAIKEVLNNKPIISGIENKFSSRSVGERIKDVYKKVLN